MMKVKIIDFGYKKLPLRAHENDAGADVHVCFHDDKDSWYISPNETVKIPSKGIVCELPPIDSGYRGEIHAIVTNCSDVVYKINNGDRIGQLVITPVVIADFITEDISQRGDNGFGSTGT